MSEQNKTENTTNVENENLDTNHLVEVRKVKSRRKRSFWNYKI